MEVPLFVAFNDKVKVVELGIVAIVAPVGIYFFVTPKRNNVDGTEWSGVSRPGTEQCFY